MRRFRLRWINFAYQTQLNPAELFVENSSFMPCCTIDFSRPIEEVAISPCWRQTIFASGRYADHAKLSCISPQERSMGTVMVKCPETGHSIPTGIVADSESFSATPVFFAKVYCPLCRTEHEWFAKEAWVRESESIAPPQYAA
jgi:hypothetical protein